MPSPARALTKALYTALSGDATLAAYLASYGDGPAVFSGPAAPYDAPRPYVVITALGGARADGLTSTALDLLFDLRMYADDAGGTGSIEDAADRMRVLFHRARPALDGYRVIQMTAEPATPAPFEDGVIGRIVSVRAIITES